MKKSTILCLLILLTNTLSANLITSENDTLFVWAKSGLNLRTGRSIDSSKIKTVPYGEVVVVVKDSLKKIWFSSIEVPAKYDSLLRTDLPEFKLEGSWLKVTHEQDTGYLFDGYLSSLPAIRIDKKSGQTEKFSLYLEREFIFFHESQKGDLYKYEFPVINRRIYNKLIIEDYADEKWGGGSTMLFDISIQEAFLFFSVIHNYGPDSDLNSYDDMSLRITYWDGQKLIFSNAYCMYTISQPSITFVIINTECSC